MHLDGEFSASDDIVSRVSRGIVLGPLLHIFYTSELFYIIGSYIVGYADDTAIHAVIPRQLSRAQVMKSLNHNLAAIDPRCVKWHMRHNSKKTKCMVVRGSLTNAPGYGDLTLCDAEIEEVKRLFILEIISDSKLTFDTHLHEVVSKAAKSVGAVRRAGNLVDCPLVLNSDFNTYVFSILCSRVDVIFRVSFEFAEQGCSQCGKIVGLRNLVV